jgi:hypothetical protein
VAKAEIERLLPDVEPDSTLYVADDRLRVVYTNEEWRRFAEDNKGLELMGPAWNTHLLDNMSGKAKERWASIYQLLLDGRLPHYEEDFICSSPQERRIYRLRITPAKSDEGGGPWLVHHSVRIDDKAEEREAMRRRLRALESDPEQVRREYRERVLEPRVAVPGFHVAQYLEPLDDVGGDLLWHRSYEGGVTDVIVADAMGHGEEAGVHAAKIAMMLDTLAAVDREPQDILAALNRGMLRHRPEHEVAFATGIFFRFEAGEARLRCANFGHLAPIFSRSGQVRLESGLPVGMVDTIPVWPETRLDLEEHGTRFLVFSDGVIEQFDGEGEMYGTERLLAAFRGALDQDVDAMIRRIVEDVTAFRGDAIVKDDQALIALEWRA